MDVGLGYTITTLSAMYNHIIWLVKESYGPFIEFSFRLVRKVSEGVPLRACLRVEGDLDLNLSLEPSYAYLKMYIPHRR